jgi:large subunit ribosomal protein L23
LGGTFHFHDRFDLGFPIHSEMSAVAAGRGAAFWQSLVRPGRAVYFPNIDLRLVPPNAETNAHESGMDVVTFITKPAVTKVDVKETLEKVYGIGVSRVHTVNYEGKKKRRGNYFYHRPDYKKVYVQLRERWYPPKGFAVTALDGDVDKGHKVKKSPVKSGPKAYWLQNVAERKGGDAEFIE